ncbi:alpha/beta hydrolase [Paenarthrobacter sp. NPDC057981]|uniref:alpha/beta hydrolase n=1 Tax=Paenarthrobacter sp. NPDC057981 TaxID=3346297 RepID=UPI0036DEA79E
MNETITQDELIDAPDPSGMPPLAQLLPMLSSMSAQLSHAETTEGLRQSYPQLAAVEINDVDIDPNVPARYYSTHNSTRRPLLVWAHGGAFVGGDLDMPEANWVGLALAPRGFNVLSIDYRKAVDGLSYPAPVDDVLTAWRWAQSNATRLGVGSVHLGGASAGGSLAASAALKLRDEGAPTSKSVVLAYPTLHRVLPKWNTKEIEKIREAAGMTYFSASWMKEMVENYLGDGGVDNGRYAFPAEAELNDLPPQLLLLAGMDSLRSSGEDYARMVSAAGGTTDTWLADDALHGFLNGPHGAGAQEGINAIANWLESHS